VHYNGSVARLTFGPVTAARVRRWLAAGRFDVLHLHEPVTPSLGMLSLWIADGPIVGTFHTSMTRSRSLQVAYPLIRQSLEKISARIAVSEDARRTLVEHLGGDAVVIPNGVYVDKFADAHPDPRWTGTPEAPTIAFLGRFDEPRKGLAVLLDALPAIVEQFPGIRILLLGRGNPERINELPPRLRERFELLGPLGDVEKARLLRSSSVFLAPQTGGESFGIVLLEAMSASCPVLASDLAAFRRVLDGGRYGRLFTTGDPADLAAQLAVLLRSPAEADLTARAALAGAWRYDWSTVASEVLGVYDTVLTGHHGPALPTAYPGSGLRRPKRPS
jgi:phosphatidylinositol alpha-mannosyltransferase